MHSFPYVPCMGQVFLMRPFVLLFRRIELVVYSIFGRIIRVLEKISLRGDPNAGSLSGIFPTLSGNQIDAYLSGILASLGGN